MSMAARNVGDIAEEVRAGKGEGAAGRAWRRPAGGWSFPGLGLLSLQPGSQSVPAAFRKAIAFVPHALHNPPAAGQNPGTERTDIGGAGRSYGLGERGIRLGAARLRGQRKERHDRSQGNEECLGSHGYPHSSLAGRHHTQIRRGPSGVGRHQQPP